MKNLLTAFILLSFLTGCNTEKKKTDSGIVENTETSEMVIDTTLKSSLADSPRHHEWVDLKREDGSICKAFVVYPESATPSKSIIVIHENRGLNDWAREFSDQLAAEGFLVIAPDLISNTVSGKSRTTDFEDSDKAREAIYALDPDKVTYDLNSAYNYIKSDKASTGNVSVIGFCWGGSQTFKYATNNPMVKEALVFYGTAPEDTSLYKKISAPVYGFYGGEDNRVNSTITATEKGMKEADKVYEYMIYEGAGHAFMRSGSEPNSEAANKAGRDQAWNRLLSILKDE